MIARIFVVNVFGLLLSLGAGLQAFAEEKAPKTGEACSEQGGKWAVFGEKDEKRCSLLTTDNNSLCSDSSQCQGDCVTRLDTRMTYAIEHRQKILIQGRCSKWTLNNGCYAFVKTSYVKSVDCVGPKYRKKK